MGAFDAVGEDRIHLLERVEDIRRVREELLLVHSDDYKTECAELVGRRNGSFVAIKKGEGVALHDVRRCEAAKQGQIGCSRRVFERLTFRAACVASNVGWKVGGHGASVISKHKKDERESMRERDEEMRDERR